MRSRSLARVVMASLGVSSVITLGCGTSPGGPSPPTATVATVAVEFGGRVVNADEGGPVGNVRISYGGASLPMGSEGWVRPNNTATSGGDGTFALPLNLPIGWSFVLLNLTAPSGYDDTRQRYEGIGPFADPSRPTATDRPAIRMYPTLVIRPGESIEVRVDHTGILWCGSAFDDFASCRRVLVAASPGDPVELELVPDDNSKRMALTLRPEDWFVNDPEMSVRRLMVSPGAVHILGAGTARLTARR